MFTKSFTRALIALILVAVPAVCAEFALAGGYVEYQGKLADGHLQPTLDLSTGKAFSEHFGWSAFFLSCEGWSEGLVGPTVSPTSWLQVGVSAGIESDPKVTRFGSFVWAGSDRASFVLVHEDGGSGIWTKSVAKYNVTGGASDQLSVGAHYQTSLGLGPHIEMGPKPVTVWLTWFPKGDGTNAILGVQYGF